MAPAALARPWLARERTIPLALSITLPRSAAARLAHLAPRKATCPAGARCTSITLPARSRRVMALSPGRDFISSPPPDPQPSSESAHLPGEGSHLPADCPET